MSIRFYFDSLRQQLLIVIKQGSIPVQNILDVEQLIGQAA